MIDIYYFSQEKYKNKQKKKTREGLRKLKSYLSDKSTAEQREIKKGAGQNKMSKLERVLSTGGCGLSVLR